MDIKTDHIYAVYKRLTSDLGTDIDWKWGDGKRYAMQMETKKKKKPGREILILEKIKAVIRDKGHYIMI